MEFGANEGESPVVLRILAHGSPCALESRRLGVLRKMGEGKLKRIAKAKLKVPEIVSREPFGGIK